MRIQIYSIILSLVFSVPMLAQSVEDPKPGFDYIYVKDNVHSITNAARLEIEVDPSFEFLGELHHQPTYNEKKFNVSLAVFRRGSSLLLIHAEKYSDGSGGLDYSDLKPSLLDGIPFTTRTECAAPEDEAEIEKNPEIFFIRSNGFDLKLPFVIEQHFYTSQDGTSEVVISYGRQLESCDNENLPKLLDQIDKHVRVEKAPPDLLDGRIVFNRIWIPIEASCPLQISTSGIELDRGCSFKVTEPGSEFRISLVNENAGRLEFDVQSTVSTIQRFVISAPSRAVRWKILTDLFTADRVKDHYDTCIANEGKTTPYELLESMGFPSSISRSGNRMTYTYGPERGSTCNYDEAYIEIENGIVQKVSGII
ncbi:MAG TPA: hypothetical protein VMM38_07290 [Aridibacter sp.]|nr:hypothetical protein [Aridibacter sp.]